MNPYLGFDSLEPFFAYDGLGVLVVVKTSNPGSVDIQDLPLADGRPLWQHVAGLVDRWGENLVGASGLSSVGAVVGATFPQEVADARRLMPRAVLLLPGVGAQGGRSGGARRRVRRRPRRRPRLRLALGDLRGYRRALAGRPRRRRPLDSRMSSAPSPFAG